MYNGAGDTERKAIIGTTPAFTVRLPQPTSDAASVTAVFDMAADVSTVLSAVRAPDTVDGIDAHRVALTASGEGLAVGRRGIAGTQYGAAFLVTQDGSWFPITVANIRDDRILLAEALPRGVEIEAGATAAVQYASYTAALDADVTVALTRGSPIPWSVTYTADLGADLPQLADVRITGMMHVRERIFDTGLTHHSFMEIARGFAGPDAVFGRQASWQPQIAAAHMHLVQWLRGAVEGLPDEREDGIDGGAFRMAHAYWTASIIDDDADRREEHRAAAVRAAKVGLDSIVLTDPDTGATSIDDKGVRPSILAGGSAKAWTTTRGPYYRGRAF